MNQHYINKIDTSVDILKDKIVIENKLFTNQSLEEGYKYEFININRSTFSKVSLKKVNVELSRFSHCVFIECYFRESSMRNIRFENCTFINCNFSDNKIEYCDFFYTEWNQTAIKYEELQDSLPIKHNYRSRICKTMANNFIADRNIAEYKKYFFESIKAREKHYKNIILRKEQYYSRKYKASHSKQYLPKLIFSKISGIAWGHGESIRVIVFNSIAIISLFGLIYSFSLSIEGDGIARFGDAIYVSSCNFLSLSSNINFEEEVYRNIAIIQSFIGTIFSGLFIAALAKKISLR